MRDSKERENDQYNLAKSETDFELCDDNNNNLNDDNLCNIKIRPIHYHATPSNKESMIENCNAELTIGTRFANTKIPRKIKSLAGKTRKIVRFKDFGTKMKSNRDPLPMKLRALPSSFWEQPNQPANLSPAPFPFTSSTCVIEPQSDEDLEVIQSANDCNKSPTSSAANSPSPPEIESNITVSDANTELLFSLFNTINNEDRRPSQRRGRPKKDVKPASSPYSRDDDPCLVPSRLLPTLSPARTLPDAPKNLNYSQLLNDLVFHL